ncbi:MAG: HAD family phosphatase [Alphaproteobacteria bacterium]|nr:HAD family phosphatase [Alphaproteobacteria bacterium]
MKKLLIWDFDGVIADSEYLHVRVWDEILKSEKQIELNPAEKQKLFYGVSDKTCRERVENYIPGLNLDDNFMAKIYEREFEFCTNLVEPIPGVEQVMANNNFEHCIATGATKEQHAWKMTQFQWIKKYISEQDFFTVDMVKQGKPAPDLFLLASNTKGYTQKNCIVVGDSVNDFKAATAAGMDCIAFIGATGNNTKTYEAECKKYGVFGVCNNMNDLNILLDKWCKIR